MNKLAQRKREDRMLADASYDIGYEDGFTAGLKQAAEIAGELANEFHLVLREVKKAKGARAVKTAILEVLK